MAFQVKAHAEPIAGYKLIERLGGGGFGEVWKAEAPGGLFKAIKFVYGDLQSAGDDACRAEQELKGLTRVKSVQHPYILSLERFDIIDGQLVIVMELADRTLWDRFKECRSQGLPGIPRVELISYMKETAEALDLMNSQYQLQHLDIKPQNIFLTHNHIKVADFGLVKDMEGMTGASVTGGVTPVYAAPETFEGRISRFSDQYSLAIVYQELLTGTRPFTGSTMRQLVLQHLQAAPDLGPLPMGDRPMMQRALAKNPDERFERCLDFVKAVESAQLPASVPVPMAPPVKEKPVPEKFVVEDDLQVTRGVRANKKERLPPAVVEPVAPVPIVQTVQDSRSPEAIQAQDKRSQEAAESNPGILQPALIIGLGQLGIDTLRQLRKRLNNEFVTADASPHLRMLAIDADPEALQASQGGDALSSLRPAETLNTKLYRPSHYLQGKDGKTVCDGWLNPRMIYRIPRQPTQAGARSLGRLAFVDNYRAVYRRLEAELQACCSDDTLQELAHHNELGLRTRVPRVYVVTSLAGTTGGGMFLDVAYLMRQLLRRLGCGGEVVGLFYLPPLGTDPVRLRALANTYAALTELQHFSSGRAAFSARYHTVEGTGNWPPTLAVTAMTGATGKAFTEAGPPFQRCYLVNLPDRKPGSLNSVHDATPTVGQASEFLFRELATPLGKELDARRRAPGLNPSASFYSVGQRRLVWPRRLLLEKAGQKLCGQLIERWLNKNAAALVDDLRTWTAQQWEAQGFRVENLIVAHQEGCERILKQAPEKLIAQILSPLVGELTGPGSPNPGGRGQPKCFNIGPAVRAMDELEHLLGLPEEFRGKGATPGITPEPSTVEKALSDAAAVIADACDKKLAELVVRHLIEEPRFRLAGAEEALRQFSAIVERALQAHEQLAKELNERTSELFLRIHKILESPAPVPIHTASRWKGAFSRQPTEANVAAELLDCLRAYPKCRYQCLVLQHITRLYVSLRGLLSDQIREVGFCRTRLTELAALVDDKRAPVDGKNRPAAAEKCLLPPGCTDMEDSLRQLAERIGKEDLLAFDQKIQHLLQEQFQALVHVCMGPANIVKNLAPAMIQEASNFLEPHLTGTNIAEMFLTQQGYRGEMTNELKEELRSLYAEAAPKPAQNFEAQETSIITLPVGVAGLQMRSLLHGILPGAYILNTERTDEILFFREQGPLNLQHLEQLGPAAEEAYRQAMAADAAGLHTREDIPEWQGVLEL